MLQRDGYEYHCVICGYGIPREDVEHVLTDETEGPASYGVEHPHWMHLSCAAGEGYDAPPSSGWKAIWRE